MNDTPPRPMDYYNPLARPAEDAAAPPAPPQPMAVVPIEFDTVLTQSADHAAVAAIETAMRAQQIPTFRADNGEVAGREVTLYVRGDDHAIAAPLAAEIFARRQRVKATNPPKEVVDPDWPDVYHPGAVIF